ncbi:MAG: hypothetical protein ACI30J_00285 [Paludibacteraceae bacterium]
MPDFSKIRSLDDIAAARQTLQQRADRQQADLQRDAAGIQRNINHVLNRFRRLGQTFSSVTSFFTPVSVFTSKLSKGALLLSVLKRLLRRFRKRT